MLRRGEPISQALLQQLYFEQGQSAQQIADRLDVSYHKVSYWMDRYGLQRRRQSEAGYLKHNPDGEKFKIDLSNRDLFIAGVALYLGEGGKTRSWDLDFTNSDPRVLKLWVRFLQQICSVQFEKLKARIDYYEDLDYPGLLKFWSSELGIPVENFGHPTIKSGRVAKGIYQGRRSLYGTLHIRFHDSKLKALMMTWMNDLLDGKL
jgi:hypothetical protein